jgi:hypothetical protein
MTNKRTGNGNDKSGSKGKQQIPSAALRNDKQKNRQPQRQGKSKGKQQIPPLRCGMTNKRTGNGKRQPTLCDKAAKDGAPGEEGEQPDHITRVMVRRDYFKTVGVEGP